MRKSVAILIVALLIATSVPAFAELQNVLVGGQIRIRGNYWNAGFSPDSTTARNPLFQGPFTSSFKGVAGGNPLAHVRWLPQPGRLSVCSPVSFNTHDANNWAFVEQRTKLNVRADFTEQVSAFIEFDAYSVWGENFRSDYLTGVDRRGASDVALYQAYIEANEMFGIPLRLRIGRQELKFGSGWMLGTNDAGSFFRGLSYDAVRATYATDQFSVDAFAAKLVERSPMEADGDVDLYGVYASYLGIENITLDAYWLLVRDATSLTDTNYGWFGEQVEDLLGVDDYDVTNLHTVGLRGAGAIAGFNFEAEVAYQFGNADTVGQTTNWAGLKSPYGDDDAEFGKFGANAMLGYTFDFTCAPHLFVGGAYFGGEDNRDLSFGQWLGAIACPFWNQKASVSFNRMFSDWQYGQFVSCMDHEDTNLWVAYAGVSGKVLDNLTLTLTGAYVETLEAYRTTWPIWSILGRRVTPLFPFTFIDKPTPKPMCWEADLSVKYQYTEDLSFELGYSHMFLLEGAAQGNYVIENGISFIGGTAGDDSDYIFLETKLSF